MYVNANKAVSTAHLADGMPQERQLHTPILPLVHDECPDWDESVLADM